MVESRSYHGAANSDEREKSALRLDQMASVLSNLHRLEPNTIPSCVCWADRRDQETYLVAFELPKHLEPRPMLLFDALPTSSVTSGPSLEQRFRVAYQLASTLSRIHTVSWVHKNLRSENAVFYHRRKQDPTSSSSVETIAAHANDIPGDWLLAGFEFSRPVDTTSSMSMDRNLDHNVYRHPQRWGVPTEKFEPSHDIYSLGVVLLELGIWRRAVTMLRGSEKQFLDPYKVKATLLTRAQTHLGFSAGAMYSQLVIQCLQFEGVGVSEDDVAGENVSSADDGVKYR